MFPEYYWLVQVVVAIGGMDGWIPNGVLNLLCNQQQWRYILVRHRKMCVHLQGRSRFISIWYANIEKKRLQICILLISSKYWVTLCHDSWKRFWHRRWLSFSLAVALFISAEGILPAEKGIRQKVLFPRLMCSKKKMPPVWKDFYFTFHDNVTVGRWPNRPLAP